MNNLFLFPGLGYGVCVTGASSITRGMFREASQAVAGSVTGEELAERRIFPSLERFEEVNRRVAVAVAKAAIEDPQVGVKRQWRGKGGKEGVEEYILKNSWRERHREDYEGIVERASKFLEIWEAKIAPWLERW